MNPYLIRSIGTNIFVLQEENVCIYVVCGEKFAAVIDTGYGSGNLPAVIAELTPLPQIVILTHGHPDHFLGAYHYEQAYLAPEDDAVFQRYNTEEFVASNYEDYGASSPLAQGFHAPELLSMPASFDLGGRTLEVVNLRGHTPGSVGLLLKEENLLFSGDGLTYCVWMQLAESTSVEEYLDMLLALKRREDDFQAIYNGHSPDPSLTDHLDHVLALTRDVLKKKHGTWLEQEEFSGFLAQGEGCQMLYRKEKLFLPGRKENR